MNKYIDLYYLTKAHGHLLPACLAHDVARGAGGDWQLPGDGEADRTLKVLLNACPNPNRGHDWMD